MQITDGGSRILQVARCRLQMGGGVQDAVADGGGELQDAGCRLPINVIIRKLCAFRQSQEDKKFRMFLPWFRFIFSFARLNFDRL